mgnify:CR=1 FL=1
MTNSTHPTTSSPNAIRIQKNDIPGVLAKIDDMSAESTQCSPARRREAGARG